MYRVRQPAVAGSFYPAQEEVLSHDVLNLLRVAGGALQAASPKALIVPHAGYIYSGSTAALAYAQLAAARATISRVVLIGPAHRVALRSIAVTSDAAFATPLGNIEVDQDALAALTGLRQIVLNPQAHAQEHSLEVQLPFLQRVLDRFKLVPLVVGNATPDEVAQVLELVWGGPETLIVVSSDLSHFHSYDAAQSIDQATTQSILDGAATLTHQQACGGTPINGLLLVARQHGLRPQLLGQCNSGDTAGDRARVVGYAAFAFTEHSDGAH